MGGEVDGRTIGGKYRLLSVLGEGAMGIVYRAEQLDADGRRLREVALKMIRAELSADPAFARRFLQEARVSASLRSPHVVTVFDCGRTEEGELYYTMELVDGPTLKDVLRERAPLPVEESLRIVVQVCEALEEAHGQPDPVIHRDLKPANIFVERDRAGQLRAKVGDFGIAKILGDATSGLTHAGQSPGTPRYMAPEQWAGKSVDGRTDLYALGIILYELLSGGQPFSGEDGVQALMYRHLHENPAPLPATVPAPIRVQIERLLAKEPGRRPQNATAARVALEAALAGRGEDYASAVTAPDESDAETVSPAARRAAPRRLLAVLGVLALIVLGLVFAEPLFFSSCARGLPRAVKLFLAAGMSPSAETDDGKSALMFGAEKGRPIVVRLLLGAGAHIGARTDSGESALILAARGGHTAVVKLLLDKGAKVDREDEPAASDRGETALIAAARGGYTGIVETLLAAGSDPNAQMDDGTTALMWASAQGHSVIVKRLLAAGADRNLKQHDGKTALDLASQAGHEEVVDVLRSAPRS